MSRVREISVPAFSQTYSAGSFFISAEAHAAFGSAHSNAFGDGERKGVPYFSRRIVTRLFRQFAARSRALCILRMMSSAVSSGGYSVTTQLHTSTLISLPR